MTRQGLASGTASVTVLIIAALAVRCCGLDVSILKRESAFNQPWLVETRRALHSIPELMYEEHETSQFVRDALSKLNIEFRYELAPSNVALAYIVHIATHVLTIFIL